MQVVDTTAGRLMLADLLPEGVPFSVVDRLMTKKTFCQTSLDDVYRNAGQKATVIFADRLMQLGFAEAAKAGISIGKDDFVIPKDKWDLIDKGPWKRSKPLKPSIRKV